MISNALAIKVLNAALSTGGDYAEIYCEEIDTCNLSLDNGKVESYTRGQSYGCGIRILKNTQSVYGHTSDLSEKSLIALASSLSSSYQGERVIEVKAIEKGKVKQINKIEDSCLDVPGETKIAYLKKCYEATKSVSPKIIRVLDSFSTAATKFVLFVAQAEKAKRIEDVEERSRLNILAMAGGEGNEVQDSHQGPGKQAGWKYFTEVLDYEGLAKKAGQIAVNLLSAKECPSGRFPVVITNGWGGVLFHEACGHPLEASATSRKLSVFSDSIGKQIASPLVSAFDDPTIPGAWGSHNVDSEGVASKPIQLIKDGICTDFMIDRLSGRRLGKEPNGTSRRQSYRYCPTSRMSNTYIAAGKDSPEDIIKDTKLGIYVANFGGGSVDPTTGLFNFSASEAYIIRDGKIAEMVKGCTLIGTGQEVLLNIDKVGNDLDLGEGYCGAASGSIAVCVGQPTIRLKEITVGGRGGKLK